MPKHLTSLIAHVTSAGVTPKAATVVTTATRFNKFLRTTYRIHPKLHISDPTCALQPRDVVRIERVPGMSRSKNIQYTVTEIIAPWGKTLEERPALLSREQRLERVRALRRRGRGKDKKEVEVEVEGGKSVDGDRDGEDIKRSEQSRTMRKTQRMRDDAAEQLLEAEEAEEQAERRLKGQ